MNLGNEFLWQDICISVLILPLHFRLCNISTSNSLTPYHISIHLIKYQILTHSHKQPCLLPFGTVALANHTTANHNQHSTAHQPVLSVHRCLKEVSSAAL